MTLRSCQKIKRNKKYNNTCTKSVARLVETENWSEKKQKYAHRKSIARLVDSENWTKKNIVNFFFLNNNTRAQKVLLD